MPNLTDELIAAMSQIDVLINKATNKVISCPDNPAIYIESTNICDVDL